MGRIDIYKEGFVSSSSHGVSLIFLLFFWGRLPGSEVDVSTWMVGWCRLHDFIYEFDNMW